MDVKLVTFFKNGHRKDITMGKSSLIIGRGEKCDLRVPLESVSRRHCQITREGEALRVKDLASSNGTYVNGQRVNETPLKAGDRLTIGPVIFTLQVDGQPEEIAPQAARPADAGAAPAAGAGQDVDFGELVATGDQEFSEDDIMDLQPAGEEDDDPIAALEALASWQNEDEEEEEKP